MNTEDYYRAEVAVVIKDPKRSSNFTVVVACLDHELKDDSFFFPVSVGEREATIIKSYLGSEELEDYKSAIIRPQTVDLFCSMFDAFPEISLDALVVEKVSEEVEGIITFVGRIHLKLDQGDTEIRTVLDSRTSDIICIALNRELHKAGDGSFWVKKEILDNENINDSGSMVLTTDGKTLREIFFQSSLRRQMRKGI